MKQPKTSRGFRIVITISVLFITLMVIFGLFFRKFIYWQTSTILLDESKRLFGQINKELSLNYLSTRKTIAQTIHMLGATSIDSAATLEERLAFLFHFVRQMGLTISFMPKSRKAVIAGDVTLQE